MSKKQVTIITGGGRGIGRAIALRMAKDTPVILVGRTKSDLSITCQEIRDAGGYADFFTGDVARLTTAERCLQRLHHQGKSVLHLICNAGIAHGGPTEKFDPKLFADIMQVNVNGAFNFVQACLPDIIKSSEGSIVFMSSVLGVRGYKRETAYTASKHALVGMARSLAMEYTRQGTVVVPVCPGFVDTDMTRRTVNGLMRHRDLSEAEARELVAGANESNRIIPPEEIADVVARICSREMPVDNGEPLLIE